MSGSIPGVDLTPQQIDALFDVLSSEVRRDILILAFKRGDEGLSFPEICELVREHKSRLLYHLGIMVETGILIHPTRGARYRFDPNVMGRLLTWTVSSLVVPR